MSGRGPHRDERPRDDRRDERPRGGRFQDEAPRHQDNRDSRGGDNNRGANFANVKAFVQIARRAFSEEEVQTIASMLADTRGPKPEVQQRAVYDVRDIRAGGRNDGGRDAGRNDGGGFRAERGGRSEGGRGGRSDGGGRGGARAERGGRNDHDDEPRRRNQRRPEH
eukprot:512393_1